MNRYLILLLLFTSSLTWGQMRDHENTKLSQERGSINPNGIFFNRFSGPFNGTEWFQTFPIGGSNRFRLADIFGGGFNATIDGAGNIVLDNGAGLGQFFNADEYDITPNINGSVFLFDCNRAPLTTADFPLQLDSARPANPLLAGRWINQRERIDPETGVVTPITTEIINASVGSTSLRLSDPNGGFFQGIFENGNTVVLRLVVPEPADARFASIAGTSLNLQQNVLGVIRFTSINSLEAVFLLQTRQPLGSQTQNMFHYQATREFPLQAGDINADGFVDLLDRKLLVQQLGLTVEDDLYNLAADLDLDLDVDNDDLLQFDNAELIFTHGFENDDRLLSF